MRKKHEGYAQKAYLSCFFGDVYALYIVHFLIYTSFFDIFAFRYFISRIMGCCNVYILLQCSHKANENSKKTNHIERGMKVEANIAKSKTNIKLKSGDNLIKYLKNYYEYYLLLIPGIIIIILFRFVPLYGITAAFKDYNIYKGLAESPWVGFQWFKFMFNSPDFFTILRNSITISVLELIFVFPAPIILAILLNEMRNARFKKIVQSVSYLPHFLSWVIVGGFILQFLQPYSGGINYVFRALGIKPFMLIMDKSWFYPILLTGEIWKEVGWGTILYLAAISGIDPEQYEAALVDGASRWQRIRHITLPGLSFIIVLQFVLQTGHILNIGVDKIFVLGQETTRSVSDVFSTYNYRVGIGQQRFALGTAISLFESVVGFIFVFMSNRISKKLGQDGAF